MITPLTALIAGRRKWRQLTRPYARYLLRPMGRWFISIMLMTVTWYLFLQGLAWLTIHTAGYTRFGVLIVLLFLMTVTSVEFGGRFRALGDATKTYKGVFWASLTPAIMIPLIAVTSKPLERAFTEMTLTSIDAIVPASLVGWAWLLGAMLKLTWDTATAVRKQAHGNWTRGVFRAARAISRVFVELGEDPWREERERLALESATLRASWRAGAPKQLEISSLSGTAGHRRNEIDVLKARETLRGPDCGPENAGTGV